MSTALLVTLTAGATDLVSHTTGRIAIVAAAAVVSVLIVSMGLFSGPGESNFQTMIRRRRGEDS